MTKLNYQNLVSNRGEREAKRIYAIFKNARPICVDIEKDGNDTIYHFEGRDHKKPLPIYLTSDEIITNELVYGAYEKNKYPENYTKEEISKMPRDVFWSFGLRACERGRDLAFMTVEDQRKIKNVIAWVLEEMKARKE